MIEAAAGGPLSTVFMDSTLQRPKEMAESRRGASGGDLKAALLGWRPGLGGILPLKLIFEVFTTFGLLASFTVFAVFSFGLLFCFNIVFLANCPCFFAESFC